MITDRRIYNSVTRQWTGTPRPDVQLVTALTFWEPRIVNGEKFYQTFEGHIYQYVSTPPVMVCPDCYGSKEIERVDGAIIACGECQGRGYYEEGR
jgi:hypothetical protein